MCRIQSVYILAFLYIQSGTCQEWNWIKGDNSIGTLSSSNGPGARSGSSVWTDEDGITWLFGGKGFSDIDEGKPKLLNDLWTFNNQDRRWNLVHSGTVSEAASDNVAPSPRQQAAACGFTKISMVVFGGLDEEDSGIGDTWVYNMQKRKWLPLPEISNFTSKTDNTSLEMPSARGDMASWCMLDRMYVFGGMDKSNQIFNDLWKFSLKDLEWSEVIHPNKPANPNTDSDHYPMGRNGPTTWKGKDGNLFMFGGNILGTNVRSRHLNMGYTSDMWRYLSHNNTWVFQHGYRSSCHPAMYGRKYEFSSVNIPGCRRRGAAWMDTGGRLWLYGGDGTDMSYPSVFHSSKLLADLWLFRTWDKVWFWFGGSDKGDAEPKYFWKNYAGGDALPGGRYEPIFWTGADNTFYLFGGLGHDGHNHDGYLNDLWVMDVDYLLEHNGVPAGALMLYLLMALALVLTMAGIFLYARDRKGPSIWSRLNNDVKYSQLTTTGD
ncbi:uncharacterized protein LOC124267190 [Haliotis rubra]|uniref:uncharacterized protein LOC124267190 n=1 Tax=Haliotis rubra TaxID=36100 RepID=UPI001EE610B7|nr:uncharacterized protein LOC124267190 [Haliotis rubra]